MQWASHWGRMGVWEEAECASLVSCSRRCRDDSSKAARRSLADAVSDASIFLRTSKQRAGIASALLA